MSLKSIAIRISAPLVDYDTFGDLEGAIDDPERYVGNLERLFSSVDIPVKWINVDYRTLFEFSQAQADGKYPEAPRSDTYDINVWEPNIAKVLEKELAGRLDPNAVNVVSMPDQQAAGEADVSPKWSLHDFFHSWLEPKLSNTENAAKLTEAFRLDFGDQADRILDRLGDGDIYDIYMLFLGDRDRRRLPAVARNHGQNDSLSDLAVLFILTNGKPVRLYNHIYNERFFDDEFSGLVGKDYPRNNSYSDERLEQKKAVSLRHMNSAFNKFQKQVFAEIRAILNRYIGRVLYIGVDLSV